MTTARPVLIIAGWTNSGPGHWQSIWQRANPAWRRVEQLDWDDPDPESWVSRLDQAVRETAAQAGPPLLVGHSIGALLVPIWAASAADPAAAGALLVAPVDVEATETPRELAGFAPVPRSRLPFATIVAASRTDPFLAWERAVDFASAWGASLHDCGDAGHLNTAAGFGPWPAGEQLLQDLLKRVS